MWLWGKPQQSAFNEIKNLLTSAPVLTLFDPSRHTVLSADVSSYGLGAVLLQRQENGEMKPIAYISRALTPTEQRYAQIEEALAFTWACERLSDYLLGLRFHIETDHKPLVPLFSAKKNLDELPLRVQRFRLRVVRYSFSISHVPGKTLQWPTHYLELPVSSHEILQGDVAFYVSAILSYLPATEKQVAEIKSHQHQGSVCKQLIEFCMTQWPERKDLSDEVRPYYSVAQEMSVEDGLLLRGNRMIIPSTLRKDVLKIHAGHLGITKCQERARQGVWWPGLSAQLEQLVKNCCECCKEQHQRAEPLSPSSLLDLPFQKVGTDLFKWDKKTYLLVVDYSKLPKTTTADIINHTKSIFARHGVPELVISDNGLQYTSAAYSQFVHEYGFSHYTTSPLYPQGNGEVERGVRAVKELKKKKGDPYMALLAYRATPLQCGYSPSQLLMSRVLRMPVPTTCSYLLPSVPDKNRLRTRDEQQKLLQEQNFNAHHGASTLPHLSQGSRVWLPDRDSEAVVVEEASPRSYQIETPEGTFRRALVSLPAQSEDDNLPDSDIVAGADDHSERHLSVRETRNDDILNVAQMHRIDARNVTAVHQNAWTQVRLELSCEGRCSDS